MTEKEKDNLTESDRIWDEISELPIAMFSLPNQRVKHHVKRLKGFPDAVLLTLNSPAALPALEASLDTQQVLRTETANTPHGDEMTVSHPKFLLEEADNYVIVKRNKPAPDREELQVMGEHFISEPTEESK